ncbi:hypothetical protein GBAR_LOCUS18820 [Geodia barretti]|uniref:Uncharacterized protein n=1 Tax=Geodia barretti TaxID=519541 RepID=A0AA35SQF2_GEOBA|nr:hypothetical protein GBAR_LOCUS18820 [Geodia barretti]
MTRTEVVRSEGVVCLSDIDTRMAVGLFSSVTL